MRALVQRVCEASVSVDGRVIGTIGEGLLILVGITDGDSPDDRDWLAHKLVHFRVFDDGEGVMNRSVRDMGGGILAGSQFTLYASTKKGHRPSWSAAPRPAIAQPVFDALAPALTAEPGKP